MIWQNYGPILPEESLESVVIVTIVLALFGGLGSEPISLGSYDSCYMTPWNYDEMKINSDNSGFLRREFGEFSKVYILYRGQASKF